MKCPYKNIECAGLDTSAMTMTKACENCEHFDKGISDKANELIEAMKNEGLNETQQLAVIEILKEWKQNQKHVKDEHIQRQQR